MRSDPDPELPQLLARLDRRLSRLAMIIVGVAAFAAAHYIVKDLGGDGIWIAVISGGIFVLAGLYLWRFFDRN